MKYLQNLEITGSAYIQGDIYVPAGEVFGTASYAVNAISGGYEQNDISAIVRPGFNVTASAAYSDIILGGLTLAGEAYVNRIVTQSTAGGNALIGNGYGNTIEGSSLSTILNGDDNLITSGSSRAVILNGNNSYIDNSDNSVAMGTGNKIRTANSALNTNVAIGSGNIISESRHSHATGYQNIISGSGWSTATGRATKVINKNHAHVIGYDLTASYDNTVHVNNLFVSGNILNYGPAIISSSAPVATGSYTIPEGALWYNNDDGNTYIYLSESTWVPSNADIIDAYAGATKTFDYPSASVTWSVAHNFNTQDLFLQAFDDNHSQIIPTEVVHANLDSSFVYFNEPVSGSVVITTGLGGEVVAGASGSTLVYSQSVASTTWTITHGFDTNNVIVQAYDDNYQMMIPENIDSSNSASVVLTFAEAESGSAIVSTGIGRNITTAASASYAQTSVSASYATSASFAKTTPLPQYIMAGKSADQNNVASNTDIIFDTVVASNGLSLNSNTITLTGGKVYDIEVSITSYGATNGQIEFNIYDTSNNLLGSNASIGRSTAVSSTTRTEGNSSTSRLIYAPSSDIAIKARVFYTEDPSTDIISPGTRMVIKELK